MTHHGADSANPSARPTIPPVRPSGAQLAAIALVSFAILVFEITSTRILSVVLWYHWAFLAISLAMLAIGAPGVWFALRPPRPGLLRWLLLISGPLPLLSIAAILSLGRFGAFKVVLCMGFLLVPLLAMGAAVCIFLIEARGRSISAMYGADLLGASLGALLVIPVMWLTPTPHLAASLGFLPLVAAVLVDRRALRPAVAIAAGLTAALVWGRPLEVRHSKSYDERHLRPIYERWTPTARLTFFDHIMWRTEGHDAAFGWGFGTRAPEFHIEQYWMDQDAGAGTPITRFDGDTSKVSFLNFDVTTVGYQLRPARTAAIIGGGGGRDILSALVNDVESIDAVELNPATVELVSNRFGDVSGDIYHRPEVHAVVAEGRSFLTASSRAYDLIQISLIDSWAATAAGAFALSENNLYTVQAYQLYWGRLSESGMVSTSRWRRGHGTLELPRLIALHQAALNGLDVADPNAHLAIITGGRIGNVLLSRQPLTQADRARLLEIAAERGFEVHHPVSFGEPDPAIRQVLDGGVETVTPEGFDLSPPDDDRPFFFQVLAPFGRVEPKVAQRYGMNGEAVIALQLLMKVLTVLTVVLFFAPFVLGRRLARGPGFWRGSLYFALIGVAFLLVEIPWLQRFILYLGHPSRATTVILGAVLLGAGCGALGSARLGVARLQRYGLLVPALGAAINLLLPSLFAATLGWSEPLRIAIAIAVVAPMGVMMGVFLPLGMLHFGDESKAWFWAMNGAASVLASVLSLALAMAWGFSTVAWIGIALYALAALLIRGKR